MASHLDSSANFASLPIFLQYSLSVGCLALLVPMVWRPVDLNNKGVRFVPFFAEGRMLQLSLKFERVPFLWAI